MRHEATSDRTTPYSTVPRRLLTGSLGAVVGALLLASCSSSPSPARQATTNTTTSARSVTTVPATTATLPTVSASGPLTVGAPIAVPLAANAVTATEAPDGAVFVSAAAPTAPGPTVVWVVDGNTPAAIAEHISGGVAALAADADNLYVASYSNVTSFSRATGNENGNWTLPPISTANASTDDLVSMTAANGQVLVSITQDNTVSVYGMNPNSSKAPHLIVHGTGAVVGADGSIYYERTDDHLVKRSPTGATTVGPALANKPNGLGGGVQYLDEVANGDVWVGEPAGQGLDKQDTLYATSDLHQVGTYDGSGFQVIVGTNGGAMTLVGPEGPGDCPQPTGQPSNSCVFRISPDRTMIDPTPVGAAVTIVGPYPAVIANNADSTTFEVERITS